MKVAGSLPSPAGRPRAAARLGPACLLAAVALLTPPPVAAAGLTLAPVARVALPGCDNPTPVRAPGGAIYSNVSDCSAGGGGRVSTGWVQLAPDRPVGAERPDRPRRRRPRAQALRRARRGRHGSTCWSATSPAPAACASAGAPRRPAARDLALGVVTSPDFGWGSFAQASPDGYEYVYLRDSRTAYGPADRVDLARVPKGRVADLAAWQVFAGSPAAPAWVPWANRAARRPVLSDPGRINRPHVSHLGGCWTMAVTMPPRPGPGAGTGSRSTPRASPTGRGTADTTSTGGNLGESAQFSPLWPGELLLTQGDRFEWRRYSLPGGC